LNDPLKHLTGVLDKVEAVGDLHRLWRSDTYSTGVVRGAIARDNLNAGVPFEPGGGGLGAAIGQHSDDRVGLAVGEDGAIDLAFPKGIELSRPVTEPARLQNRA